MRIPKYYNLSSPTTYRARERLIWDGEKLDEKQKLITAYFPINRPRRNKNKKLKAKKTRKRLRRPKSNLKMKRMYRMSEVSFFKLNIFIREN